MSEEEKKAIEWLKKADWFSARLYSSTILNLIDNQQKEIKRLKARKYIINAVTGEISQISLDNNYISKDKIKAKIEDLEKQQEKNRNELYYAIDTLNFKKIDKISNRISTNMYLRDYLQSLLEEENNVK